LTKVNDTDIGAIIQPPKPVTVNPLAQKETSHTEVMQEMAKQLSIAMNKLEKVSAENMALKKQNQDKDLEASQEDNDLLNMPDE